MAKARKKVNKHLTVKELKSWLRGVQEFHPDDWLPDREQWDLICERVFNLKEEPEVIVKEKEVQVAAPRNFEAPEQQTESFQELHPQGGPAPAAPRFQRPPINQQSVPSKPSEEILPPASQTGSEFT